MAVAGTYCQVCGLPVQHDHYVPREDGGGLWIYRGGSENWGNQSAVPFGPEHDWLLEAVGLRLDLEQQPGVIEGEVHDGHFAVEGEAVEAIPELDGYVSSGVMERAAVHRVCWDLAGQPNPWPLDERSPADIQAYCQQLFDFAGLVRDGKSWMLVDPRLDTPEAQASKARITRLAEPTWVGRLRWPGR